MKTGAHGPYRWLEADHDLREFLSLCPGTLVGRHIAITALDSGSFNPSGEDRAAGWSDSGGIAYSPRLESVAMLPPNCCCRECCGGFDEWYIFGAKPRLLGSICHANIFDTEIAPPNVFQFINFGGFQLSDPQFKAISDLFWKQMEWVRPESYLGDGDCSLLFVSSDSERFGSVRDILSRSPSRYTD